MEQATRGQPLSLQQQKAARVEGIRIEQWRSACSSKQRQGKATRQHIKASGSHGVHAAGVRVEADGRWRSGVAVAPFLI
jgi:predicted transcriptional regulator